jgi:hypothetical protein
MNRVSRCLLPLTSGLMQPPRAQGQVTTLRRDDEAAILYRLGSQTKRHDGPREQQGACDERVGEQEPSVKKHDTLRG